MRRATRTTTGWAAAAIAAAAALLAAAPAEAGCTRSIVNKTGLAVAVSRDGGPWVTIPPHRAQAIHYYQPGRIDVALLCPTPYGAGASPAPESAIWRGSFSYSAIIDRCYFEIGDGFFEEQLGPGFGPGPLGVQDTKPLTLNVPRQGDAVVGPIVEERCPSVRRDALRARY